MDAGDAVGVLRVEAVGAKDDEEVLDADDKFFFAQRNYTFAHKMHSLTTFSLFAQTPGHPPILCPDGPDPPILCPAFYVHKASGSSVDLGQSKRLVPSHMEGDRRFVYNCCHSLGTENATDGR